MILNGMLKTEALFFRSENDVDDMCYVEMEKDCEEDTFYVRASHNDEWEWKFYDKASNYELIKHVIFDIAFDSHSVTELIDGLDEIFEDAFSEMLVFTCNCDGSCTNCTCKK